MATIEFSPDIINGTNSLIDGVDEVRNRRCENVKSNLRCATFKFIIPFCIFFIFVISLWMIKYDHKWIFMSFVAILFVMPYIWYCVFYKIDSGEEEVKFARRGPKVDTFQFDF